MTSSPCRSSSIPRTPYLRALAVLTLATSVRGAEYDAPAPRAVPIATYARADRFGSRQMDDLVSGGSIEPHWIANTHAFWYRRADDDDGWAFILVDADAGTVAPAFDHAAVARSLGAALGMTVVPWRLPLERIVFSPNRQHVEFTAASQRWRCERPDGTCHRVANTRAAENDDQAPEPAVGRADDDAPERQSARWRVAIRNGNLWLEARDGSRRQQLTGDANARTRYGHVTWAPDGNAFIAFKTYAADPGEAGNMYTVESRPEDRLRPRLHTTVYALPGDPLDTHEPWLFRADNWRAHRIEVDPVNWGGPPPLRWDPDGASFTYEQLYRGYQRRRLVRVDARTGRATTVIDEVSKTCLPPMKFFVHYLDRARDVIRSSERDGWNHLYLYDLDTGRVKRRLTKGAWAVRSIEFVDETARQLCFTAGGREPNRDPYLRHVYLCDLDAPDPPRLLTPGDGDHDVTFSPDRTFYLDAYSRVDRAPVVELRRTSDASLVRELSRADVSRLLATGWRWPEPFVAKGRDGETDICGVIFRPSTFDPNAKYPVIEDIYAGPHDSFVPKSFLTHSVEQAIAELGFIVVKIDGMGTSNRSKAFQDVAYKNLADSGFPDRIAWMRAAAAAYPCLDTHRVGIYGGSAGGYNAARALIAHNDWYSVAVAFSGNHDHRTDKVWWNELWMGYPVGPHYAEQSNVTHAGELRGHLLLMHGELDTNVNPAAATMRFADALIRANRPFDMLILPGKGHCELGAYGTRRLWDYFVTNLRRETPPDYRIHLAESGEECSFTVTNATEHPVSVLWLSAGNDVAKKYFELPPHAGQWQHSFAGHEWEARVRGRPVARYVVSPARPVWRIDNGPCPLRVDNPLDTAVTLSTYNDRGETVKAATVATGEHRELAAHPGQAWIAEVDGQQVARFIVYPDHQDWRLEPLAGAPRAHP